MTHFLKLYLVALPVFLIIDLVWLGLIANNLYQQHIGSLLKTNVNWPAAIIFYLIFVVGLVVFVISPALASSSWLMALGMGALFGLVTYAAYDLTNLAVAKDWPLMITVIDLIWGSVLAASVSTISYFVAKKFGL